MRPEGPGAVERRGTAVSGSARASRRNGRMPRCSSASRQASLARSTFSPSSLSALTCCALARLRRAASSRPTAATRRATPGHGSEHPASGDHGAGERRFRGEHPQDVADQRKEHRARAEEHRREHRADGDGSCAGGLGRLAHGGGGTHHLPAGVVEVPSPTGGSGGRRRLAQFLAHPHVVLVFGGRGRRDEGSGVEGHRPQLLGVEALANSGELRSVQSGAQRLIEDPLIVVAVLAQQVRRSRVAARVRAPRRGGPVRPAVGGAPGLVHGRGRLRDTLRLLRGTMAPARCPPRTRQTCHGPRPGAGPGGGEPAYSDEGKAERAAPSRSGHTGGSMRRRRSLTWKLPQR